MPLAGKGFMSGFILIFISAMKELDLLVLLMTPFDVDSGGNDLFLRRIRLPPVFPTPVTTLIVLIIMIVYLVSAKLGKVDMSKGLGG